ncbi:serine-rich adhesin for platelets [Anastrepha ludens]|uniref:serine-rich adhesin for platelets n=1 Tax=Anastrepha ludens TaxID=28586 RepID=UPI0023AF814E|nr:serine-rich adhesin for platelets [Anastrepha ludens]XP_053951190.1 serine-rich adhesin for platelets [Anastrepha ludens]XP_053951191.1 serine-rich adhesin for platelets [Anastrepha ludens]
MSTRKTSAAATTAAATTPQAATSSAKSENATAKGASATSTTAKTIAVASTKTTSSTTNTSAEEKAEMGSNASTVTCVDVEMSEVTESVNTNKETTKTDIKRASSEPKRITRNSPLLLASPTPSSGARKESRSNETCDSELTNSESEDGGGAPRRSLPIKGRKSLKECRETKISAEKDKTETDNAAEVNESHKAAKDVKEKEVKVSKEIKECKKKEDGETDESTKDNSLANTHVNDSTHTQASATNRLTRKSVAQELAANTRVTRNRQSNTYRPETPPNATTSTSTRPRRSTAGKKNSFSSGEPASKRKRADDEGPTSGTTESHVMKSIKIEPKDDFEVAEDELPPPNHATASSSNETEVLKIKSEPVESDESATDVCITNSSVTRSRSRWSARKPHQTSLQNSPSTRATRHSKTASPSPTPLSGNTVTEGKRKRINAQSNALTRSSSLTLLKTAAVTGVTNPAATPLHVPDDDSKDSMASSSIDDLLPDIKMEKLTPDLADEINLDNEVDEKHVGASSAVAVPLTVETEMNIESKDMNVPNAIDGIKDVLPKAQPSTSLATTSNSSAANEEAVKAASLSPEMVSEGVSEISVKQFYKKPKFLENNLGIEEDPKLGEIVQKVSTEKEKDQTSTYEKDIINAVDSDGTSIPPKHKAANDESDAISIESDEIKEGDLRVDETLEDKKNSFTEDANSLSTEILSPLVIEEDDEVDAIAEDVIEITECAESEASKGDKEGTKQDLEDLKNVEEIEGEDDVTMEECETISIDNPPVHENIVDETPVDGDLENDSKHLENAIDFGVSNGKDKKIKEKTKTECDSIEAKLTVENENNIDTKDELTEGEMDAKVKCLVEEEKVITKYSEDKPLQMDVDGDECIDLAEAMDTVHSDEEDETKLCIDMQEEDSSAANMEIIENIEDDEVVAKIDAELKKYDDLEKSKVREKVVIANSANSENNFEHKEIKLPLLGDLIKSNCILKDEKESISTTDRLEQNESNPVEIALLESAEGVEIKESNDTDNTEKETPFSSTANSPAKPLVGQKEDDSTSMKSGQSTDSSSWVTLDLEHDEEALRQKEQHLQNLGLLTHKAAEKQRQEYIKSSAAAEASRAQHQNSSSTGSKRNGKSSSTAVAQEYTGTLKTVIKINRNTSGGSHASTSGASNGRKSNGNGSQHSTACAGTSKDATNGGTVRRQSLKMTFQKGRARGQGHADRAADQHSNVEDAYYTIQNENEGGLKAGNAGSTAEHSNVQTHGRKSYNRSNTTSHSTNTATIDSSHSESYDAIRHHPMASTSHKKDEKEEILIPEKASSFKFHPERICDDQCFYCSGKFGIYDTPCHVGQLKSAERQQKILANEEKITVDSCLCDACFRHVDRRANVPSYKKRVSVTGGLVNRAGPSSSLGVREIGDAPLEVDDAPQFHKCLVPNCANPAARSLRRKCIRKSVKKFLLKFDMPTGSTCVWLCQNHYGTVMQCTGCVLCKRRLGKNHMYHITSDTDRLEKALTKMGIPVKLGIGTAVCKLCRYFANLLMKPPETNKEQKDEFVRNYRKRLLQFHNIHDGSNDASEADDEGRNCNNFIDDAEKPHCSKSKTQKKLNQTDSSIVLEVTPVKNLPSPADSNGSSIECLGETTPMEVSASENNDSEKQSQSKPHLMIASDVLVDYDPPTTLSTDSNSSSAPMSPTNSGAPEKQQMSKLKAILQSSSGSSSASASAVKSSSSSTAGTAANDISNVLRANPNISMRELFPGEEDLGLNFKVPFGSSTSQRTPEGWTRVQTFLQYDEATRRLWEELQKPYGNQSSFLRHLILLEKYYRNGDLVLSPNASSNANVYTQTVRQRLTSYDQGHCGGLVSAKPSPPTSKRSSTDIPTVEINEDDDEPKRTGSAQNNVQQMEVEGVARESPNSIRAKRSRSDSVDKLTKQLSSNAVTIIARPKPHTQPAGDPSPQKSLLKEKSIDNSVIASTTLTVLSGNNASGGGNNTNNSNTSSNSRSILKTNLLGMNKAVEIVPISAASSSGAGGSNAANTSGKTQSESKHQKILDLANKLLDNRIEAAAAAAAEQTKTGTGSSLLTSPPELVSLQRRSVSVASGNSTNTVSANAAPSASIATVSSLTASLINNKRPQGPAKGVGGTGENNTAPHRVPPPNVVILPDTLTVRERQQRSWRPTLMPVEENLHLIDKGGPLYQTADGRRLPALVQVLSGGKPFLISIFDYNRMCILRREKLLRDQMLKTGKNPHDPKQQHAQQQQQQQHQQQNAGKVVSAPNPQVANFNKHVGKQQHQHQQQQQQQQQQQHQAAQQQLMHLQMLQMQKQAALKPPGRYPSIAPKTTATISHNGGGGGGVNGPATSHAPATNVNVPISSSSVFSSPMMPLLTNAFSNPNSNPLAAAAAAAAATAKLNTNAWIWNFPEPNHMINGNMVAGQGAPKLPQLLHKGPPVGIGGNISATITSKQQQQQQQHQQMLIDNTLMSKIPKTLTVIPQHKLMGTSGNTASNISHKE